jgi:hypothetical protein
VNPATKETRRTAFQTAYLMGAEGRDLFYWLAEQNDSAIRRDAVLSLYLEWRRDRAGVFAIMDELAARVRPWPFGASGRVLAFLVDLSVTIYINHPEDEELLERTSRVWSTVLVDRLHLNTLLFLVRGPLKQVIGRAFAKRTLNTALMNELQSPSRFFRQSDEERARFLRTVALIDPDVAIDTFGEQEIDDLVQLFRSDILLHGVLAALVLAIHATVDPKGAIRTLDRIGERLKGESVLWALFSFCVPYPETPDSWVGIVERMTDDLIRQDRATFFGDGGGLQSRFDIGLLPLGLAYGKRGDEMPLVDRLLAQSLAKDPDLAQRIVRGLASVGLYYPLSVFTTLRPHAGRLIEHDAGDALARTLATMRILHVDRVDLFLAEIHAPDELRAKVAADQDLGLIVRCINWIGYFNNAVHQAVRYPAMRRTLLMGGLTALGNARSPADFIGPYTDAVIDLGKRAGFRLIRWTDPTFDEGDGAATIVPPPRPPSPMARG